MAKARGSGGGSDIGDIAKATAETAALLKQLLNVAKFGPGAAGSAGSTTGGGGRSTAELAKMRAETLWNKQQNATFERAKAFGQVGLGGMGAGMSRAASMAGGMQTLGIPGAAMLSRFAGPAGIAMSGMNTAASAARIGHDAFATNDQKLRSLVRMMPGGETLQNWRDSFSGRAAGMELANYHSQVAHAAVRGRLETSAFNLSHNPQQAGLAGMSATYGRQSAVTMGGVFDRTTGSGRQAFEDAQRALPYRKEAARTERELAQSTASRVAAEQELNGLQVKQNNLLKMQKQLEKELAGNGSGVDRQVTHETLGVVNAQIEGYTNQIKQAGQSVASARSQEASAKGEHSKAKMRADLLVKADTAGARAQAGEASAGRLGSMGPLERSLGLQAIEMLESGANPDLMPAELKQYAQQLDPQAYGDIIAKHGAGSAEYKAREAKGKAGFTADYAGKYAEEQSLRNKAGEAEFATDSAASGELVKAGAELGKFFADQVKIFVAAAQSETLNNFRKGKNAN